MFYLIYKKHNMRNTKLTPADRFKTDAINTHVKSARHTNAVELELLSRVSVFHKDHMKMNTLCY